MTDAKFEAFMARLDRTMRSDAKGTTRLGQRYAQAPRDPTQSDHTADVEFHRYNHEWTGDPK